MLAITELWRAQPKYQTKSTVFTTSSPIIITKGPRKGQRRFEEDRAAGVGIILSKRAKSKLLSFGSQGERVCWVRLEGPTCNLFIIAVYLPHRGRVCPSQDDTIKDLETVLSKVPRGDCVVLMGDLNEQLESDISDRTGKWTAGPPSPNSDKILQLMYLHDLTAMNTLFKPKSTWALCTFLQTKKAGQKPHNDFGEYVGAKVKTKYNGREYVSSLYLKLHFI